MKAPPDGIDERALSAAVASRWEFDVESLSYEAVGGGSHHWLLRTAEAGYRFLTVDDLSTKPWLGVDSDSTFPALDFAFRTAGWLRESGLEFVVAPIPTMDGGVLVRLDERFSAAVFPFISGRAGTFGEPFGRRDREDLLALWARLHRATASAPRRSLDVPGRAELDEAMNSVASRWAGGPYSERAREWLNTNRDLVTASLRLYDRLAGEVGAREFVVTHGEPHGGNLIRTEEGLRLVDWDTVAMAPPERDLWMLDDGTNDGFRPYTDATGHLVDRSALSFYRLAWLVTDVASFVAELHGAHAADDNSAHAWTALQVTGESLSSTL